MKGLLTSLITVLTFTGLQAQSLPTAPKLVVGLTIDQLRTDYLESFFVALRRERLQTPLERGKSIPQCRIYIQRCRPCLCHGSHLQRINAFRQRDHFQPMDGCSYPYALSTVRTMRPSWVITPIRPVPLPNY